MTGIFLDRHEFYFGAATYKNGGKYGPELYTKLAMLLLHEGEVEVTCDGSTHLVKRGEVTLVYSEQSLEYNFIKNSHQSCSWCDLNEPLFDKEIIKELRLLPLVLPMTDLLETFYQEGLNLEYGGGNNRTILRNAIGQAIYYEYFERAKFNHSEPLPDNIKRMLEYIDTHISEHFEIKDIAEHVGITVQSLISKFHDHMGISPSKYIWKLRARRTFDLIVHTNKSIAEIAYDNGFQTPQHFSRFIKEQFGLPPTELRKREQ